MESGSMTNSSRSKKADQMMRLDGNIISCKILITQVGWSVTFAIKLPLVVSPELEGIK
ncbi:hypothetical protein SLEP1_g15040 [Rubroshorea leprosula]|uniref:Uncharacterized protein n=1 Tax=Rubroshorea leprosula TaxID=152421 RepID=A0AAV5IVI7_9ROSI|nr:hypothetical protein SLEP1_g15040 [Rubroshorea leprosula]